MSRPDISPFLIHFTKPNAPRSAIDVIQTIIGERRLLGSAGAIRGGHQCVCFTEAPLMAIARQLVDEYGYNRYSPYGVMFDKEHIYDRGGRPVIYGGRDEYALLPPQMNWRHVRYEPSTAPPIDFTWEREWRMQVPQLDFDPAAARIVVPDADAAARLRADHFREREVLVQQYSQIMDPELAEQYFDPFPWRIVILDE